MTTPLKDLSLREVLELEKQKTTPRSGRLTRDQVYALINGERDYQDRKWNADTCTSAGVHTPTEWLVFIEDYLLEAKHVVSREADQSCHDKVMANIRKIGAMCVACMEQNGAPARDQ